MQTSIATRHGNLSDDTKSKVTKKLEKVHRFFDRLTAVELTVDLKDEQNPAVTLHVSAEHRHDFVAEAQSSSLLTAVESAVHKIEQQLRKYKDRVQQKHRSSETRREEVAAPDGDADEAL